MARGEAFLLQGGDCAETFAGNTEAHLRENLDLLARAARILSSASGVLLIKVAGIALPDSEKGIHVGFPVSDSMSSTVARLRTAGCVFAEDEACLLVEAATSPAELEALVRRRVDGEPLEVILGWAEFCGRRIEVDPRVFVPRQRSEFLVVTAAGLARPGAVVVDLCCGTGALGVAVAVQIIDVELYAADVDPNAVRCAARNVGAVGGQALAGDLYAALPEDLRGRIDLLLVNAPYVPTEEIDMMPWEAREYEPRVALDGGPDGVDVHRRVAAKAPHWLAHGGQLLIETSEAQAAQTSEALTAHWLSARVVSSDELFSTVVIGTMPELQT